MKTPERPLHDYLAEVCECTEVRAGVPLPMGTHEYGRGVNFAFFSRHASRVRLELFDLQEATPARVIDLDPACNRTGDVWHVWVEGIYPGQLYAYRVDSAYQPGGLHRFKLRKFLLEPFATVIARVLNWDFGLARRYVPSVPERDILHSLADGAGAIPKLVFTQEHFDWQGDQPLRHPWSKTVIYEASVRGLTIHPSSVVENPGTYRGLMEKIPYLKDLGVTVVELMPVQEFNESRATAFDSQKLEFREMVQAFHKAGIELILDVVFNHAAEGNELGPTLCFRGMDNAIFYTLAGDKRYYQDYKGTGNTINANHPVVRDHILAALRYWMVEMHVDGFRFDLASVLGRDRTGKLLANAPLLERIAKDPILRNVQIIAEDWDAAVARERAIVSGRSTNLPSEPEFECHASGSNNERPTVADGVGGGQMRIAILPALFGLQHDQEANHETG
jgi:isoamylase